MPATALTSGGVSERAVLSRRAVISGLLRDAARVDRTQSDPVVAARSALGVVAPLAIGVLAGNASLGLAATIGALQVTFADRPGPYRLRLLRMVATTLAVGVTSGAAVLLSHSDVASVLLLFVLSLVAGLLLAGGPSATQTGIAGVVAALVLGHLPQPPSAALHVAALVVAGGAGQIVLALAGWPLGRHRPERLALAALYHELADAARAATGSRSGPPAGVTLTSVRQTLYGLGHDHGRSVEAYRVLLDEAERIRRDVVVIIAFAQRLAGVGQPILAGWLLEALTAIGGVLDEIGDALAAGRAIDAEIVQRGRDTLSRAVDRLERDEGPPGDPVSPTRRAAADRLRSLSGQLRAALRGADVGAAEGRHGEPDVVSAGSRAAGAMDRLRDALAVLRANVAFDATVLRHAVRVAVVVAGTDAIVRAVHVDRGYWVSLTVLVVLRPDFGATLQRAVMRVAGTVIGLLLASALVEVLPQHGWWQVALIAVLAFGMRLAGPNNVALLSICVSGLVVVLLEINGVPAHTTLLGRALATLTGGVLAVLAALTLPSWERDLLPQRLVELIGAYRTSLLTVADPTADRRALDRARAAARRARTNAEASVDRAAAEPVGAAAQIELGRTVLANSHRFIHALLAIEAVRASIVDALPARLSDEVPNELSDAAHPGRLPQLSAFVLAAADALQMVQTALQGRCAPVGRPRLRPLQEQLSAAMLRAPELVGGEAVAATVADATDRITDSLDTLLAALRRPVLA